MYALTEMLERVPDAYAEALSASLAPVFKAPVNLQHALTTPEGLLQIVAVLNDQELALLKTLVFSGAGEGIEAAQVWRSFDSGDWRGSAGRLLCERLRALGLVFEAMGGHGRSRYIMASETYEGLSHHFFAEAAAALPEIADRDVGDREDYPMAMLCDIVRTLASLGTDGAALTHAGELFKKDLSRVEKGFLARDWFKGGPPYRPEFPGRTAFIIEFGLERGLLEQTNKSLRAREEAGDWVSRRLNGLLEEIYGFWRRWFLPRLGRVAPLLGVLAHQPVGRWFGQEQLLAAVEPYLVAEWAENLRIRAGGLLRSALHLGLLQAGTAQGRSAYCLTDRGRFFLSQATQEGLPESSTHDRFYLQPSFEILTERELSPGVLWRLELVAELVRLDGLRTYRLTRESVHRGLRWLSLEEVLEFLQAHSVDQPQNVLHTLGDWGAGFGRARFVPGTVLRCEDSDLVELIIHSPRLEEHIERLNEHDVLVPSSARAAVAGILDSAGVTLWPADEGEDPTGGTPRRDSAPDLPDADTPGRRLGALHLNGFLPTFVPTGEQGRRDILTQAIRAEKRVQIIWAGPTGTRVGRVEPLALVQGSQGWELLCTPLWSGRETRIPLAEIQGAEVLED